MKVLIVINSLDTGGAEKLVLDSLPKFKEKGLTVELLVLNGRETPFLSILEKLHCCKIHKLSSGSVYNPLLIFRLIPYMWRYKLIHVHLFPALYWVSFAKIASFASVKLVFTEHNTKNRRRSSIFFRILDRFVYSRYDKIITISTEVKLFLKEHLAFKNKKFTTITNGVDLNKFSQNNKEFISLLNNTSNQERIIVQIAAFTKQKDQETLLKAIPFISSPVRLLLIGEGPLKSKLETLSQSLEIENKVTFLPVRMDIHNILDKADLAVLSSHHEGLSLSGVEAMASGTPLLASNVSGLKTLVFGAGVLFKHSDEIDLANKINELLNNNDYYKSVAISCKKRAQKYSLDTMLDKHLALYEELYNSI